MTTTSVLSRARDVVRAMWPGMKLGWIPIALVMLAHVPGRRVFADNEAMHGRPGWQFLWAGLSGDLLYVAPPVLFAFIVPLAIVPLLERRQQRRAAAAASVFAIALASSLLVSAWMFSVGAIESKLERGLYPTYLETKVALGSSSFVIGQLPTLMLDRYRTASVLVVIVSVALLFFHQRRARRDLRSLAAVAGFAVSGFLLFGLDCEVVKLGRIVFPRTGSYAETRSPIETVALGRFPFPNHTPITDGMRLVFSTREYPLEQKRAGLHALGYGDDNVERLLAFEGNEPCTSPHPLARPLERVRGAQADAVLDDLEALSSALFTGRDEPVVVWQIAMESFRADDLHALHPEAAAELTPVMSRLYGDRRHVIGFKGAFQGGFRTAQGLSSLHCGIGSLPFNMAVARDMGHFPLRCLPDVLADGGFDARVFYASDLAYDNMLDFFRYHGVEGTQAADMPAGLPIGSWRGVSDRALYDQALAHASSGDRSRSLYEFVLTLSGHSPFAVPTDMPPEVAARTAEACKKSTIAREDDCKRLGVIAYADFALGEFLDKLERSPVAGRSVVVVSADHATSEMFLWPGSAEEKVRAHVPYLMIVPEAHRAAASHPERVEALVERLHERAETQVISLMDSPTLVTALLSSTRELRSIPAPWRFHTYGGQVTSPHFAFGTRPSARVWGTDSAAFVFSVDADASVKAYENKNRAFSGPSELDVLNPSLQGPAAFLSSFAKGYLGRCEAKARLRMARSTTATR